MRRLVLLNPNTNAATTESMCAIARQAVPGVGVDGLTAPRGVSMITTPGALVEAGDVVAGMALEMSSSPPDGLIIGAFGDPGLERAARVLACPVTGLGEAAMREAGAGGRSFAVVTVTPDLVASITHMAHRLGLAAQFRGVVLTDGDLGPLMGNADALLAALQAACERALAPGGLAALVIGGGPLGAAADALAARFRVPLINPVAAAARLAVARMASLGATCHS
ncbi:aspartate/glutamate racemase family protein [Aquabacter cavernae]|uniref:aspartate/glutamate racemase family protein n=1 Tax=Aquabacter cavernae TaxID=2496029 RepID=UPI000F8D1290|nr:aspartate/glutamate racemase family protein [Aquabacter cavernae]